jgi:hypothetical protein
VRKKLILLMALVALVATGCIQADLKLDVKDDGSGTYSAVIAVNAKLFQSLGGLSALDPSAEPTSSSTDICQQMIDDSQKSVPTGGKVEPYKKGDFCGVKLSAPFANIDEGIALLNDSSSSGGATLQDVTLAKQGNGWVFAAKWNPSSGSDATTGADAAMTKQFLQGFSFVVRIKLPGGQVQQNADLLEGDGTMVWNLDPTAPRSLSATTDANAPVKKGQVLTDAGKNVGASGSAASGSTATGGGGTSGGSSKTWLYIVIGLVVVAAIAAVVLMKRNKAKTAPVMAGMPGAPMAAGSMMSSPPMSGPPTGSPPMAAPMAPPAAPTAAPQAAPAAAPQPVATEPQWDAARNAYIQYDGVNARWMQYDQTAGAWKPIE